jgi:MurNAc alpha-1-phosphate uridylyltransferase
MNPTRAMVLAAGLATRMRPLTDKTAKPLLPLAGRTLLDHALDRLGEAGVTDAVVNAHWHADLVAKRLDARAADGARPRTTLQLEDTLLETGGAVARALPRLGTEPFYVVNGDAFWIDGPRPALRRLVAAMTAEVDGVLLVHRTFQIQGEVGYGDFVLDPWGALRRRREREVAPYLYAGVQLIRPALVRDAPVHDPGATPGGKFSMNLVWDQALAAGRLRAVVHDGLWFHLSTPPDLAEAEALISAGLTGESR